MISYGIAKAAHEEKWTLYSLVDTNYNGIAKNFVFEGTYEECQEKMKEMKEMDKLTDGEIKELRAKKQTIREELYDKVKMEMFAASSALEGMTPAEALDEMVRFGEEHGLYDIPVPPKDNTEDKK